MATDGAYINSPKTWDPLGDHTVQASYRRDGEVPRRFTWVLCSGKRPELKSAIPELGDFQLTWHEDGATIEWGPGLSASALLINGGPPVVTHPDSGWKFSVRWTCLGDRH